MSVTTTPVESVPVRPSSGCGTIESPWTGWEDQAESRPGTVDSRTLIFATGFWAVSRPIRLGSAVTLTSDAKDEGRPWFLPAPGVPVLDTLFRVDGADGVTLAGICLNGREDRARHGVVIRCGTRIHLTSCHFGDFRDPEGAGVLLAGESDERHIQEVVVSKCRFVNGRTGIRLERNLNDMLVNGNRFEEISGPAIRIDPEDRWADYGLIAVKNRMTRSRCPNDGAFLEIHPGAEGIRFADNSIEAPEGHGGFGCAGVDVRGGGPMSRRRLELVNNRMSCIPGPAIAARQCGPGFLAAGNHAVACGTDDHPAFELHACQGIVVEDNEMVDPVSAGVVVRDCSGTRVNGNEITGSCDGLMPRGGTCGVVVEGDGSRQLRVTDNRMHGLRDAGVSIHAGTGVRVVGNEVRDCGVGIRARAAKRLVLVGNDCRDNGEGGIRIEGSVDRAYVALNCAILNGAADIQVAGSRIRCHDNKVDRAGSPPTG